MLNNKFKQNLLVSCNYITIVMIPISIFFPIIVANLRRISVLEQYTYEQFNLIRSFLIIPIIILWIYCFKIWSKKDKSVKSFLLLFFLNGFYIPFYFHSLRKKKWIF